MSTRLKILIGILTVCIVLFVTGLAYAYFLVNINGEGKDVTVTAANLSATFTDGDTLNISNIEPGWSMQKEFSVENTGDVDVKYKIVWNTFTNGFINKTDLLYSITSTSSPTGATCGTLTQTQLPSAAGDIITDITIPAGTTCNYTMNLSYRETNTNQSSDMGKTFNGKLGVEALENNNN